MLSRPGRTISTKQFSLHVRYEFDVPRVYTLGTVEEVEEALLIGSMVQQSVKTQRSSDDLKKLTELKDGEIQTIRATYQQQLGSLQSTLDTLTMEKDRIGAEYNDRLKASQAAERDSCVKEWEEKLRLLKKDHDGLTAKYEALEVRRRVLEESRDKDIQDAVARTEGLMEKIIDAKQNQLDKMEAAHTRLHESIVKQSEEIGKLGSTLGKRNANVKQKGNDFEDVFGEKLRRFYGVCSGFSLRQTALNGTGHEMDFVMDVEGHAIMWELKKYGNTVPKAEVDKFIRDLKENPNSNIGIMVSNTTDIQGKAGTGSLLTEFEDNKMMIYVNRFEEFAGEDEGRLFQMLLSLCRIWWHYGKADSGAFDRAEMIRELEKAVEDIAKRRVDWKRHKAHMDELSRWTVDLLEESEARLDRILKKARHADQPAGAIIIPDGVFRETVEEKDVLWIGSVMRVCQAGGEIEVRELVDLLGSQHKLSKDTIRTNLMSLIKDSAVVKKGTIKWIKGITKGGSSVSTPCLIQMNQVVQ